MGLIVGRLTPEGYEPSLLHRALWPGVSGNDINGLGEGSPRRPSPVYWHGLSRIPHGKLQISMGLRMRFYPELWYEGFTNTWLSYHRPGPVAKDKVEVAPGLWAAMLREVAFSCGADLVGITAIRPEWVFEGYEVPAKWIVLLGVAMDHARLSTAPGRSSVNEVLRQYNRGGRAAHKLAGWIRGQGHHALGHCGPNAGAVSLVPAALAAGFGELGRHGSIINRKYGASFRLASVVTELPLVADPGPDEFGADGFCQSCKRCLRACPVGAIHQSKQLVRGTRKWYVDFDRCIPYFNDTFGCAICLGACPWSRAAAAPGLVRKMAILREKKARAYIQTPATHREMY